MEKEWIRNKMFLEHLLHARSSIKVVTIVHLNIVLNVTILQVMKQA